LGRCDQTDQFFSFQNHPSKELLLISVANFFKFFNLFLAFADAITAKHPHDWVGMF
jgi:hypothetical protein